MDEQVALLRYLISFSIPTSDPHSSRVPSLWDGFIQGFALQKMRCWRRVHWKLSVTRLLAFTATFS